MTIRKARSLTYKVARGMGDVQAVSRGPSGVAKRVVRRKVYRVSGGVTRKFLRGFGL